MCIPILWNSAGMSAGFFLPVLFTCRKSCVPVALCGNVGYTDSLKQGEVRKSWRS